MSFSYKRRRAYSTAGRNARLGRSMRRQFPGAARGAFSTANVSRAFARGRASTSRYSRAGSYTRWGLPAPARRSTAMVKQVKGLLAAKTRDAADVNLGITAYTGSVVGGLCSSSTVLGSAPYGSGLLQTDADEVLLNSLRIRGMFILPAVLLLDPTNHFASKVRRLIVWFNKPLQVAVSGGGTLPSLSEVLITTNVDSLPINDATNGGRFVILSDRVWDIGTNTFQSVTAAGSARVNGRIGVVYDYTVKIGRKCTFKAPSTPGAGAGGHYDAANATGLLSSGLLMMYTIYQTPSTCAVTDQFTRRLNYTG